MLLCVCIVTLSGVKLLKILGYLVWCCLFLNIPIIISLSWLVTGLENENIKSAFPGTELERCLYCTNVRKAHFCSWSKCCPSAGLCRKRGQTIGNDTGIRALGRSRSFLAFLFASRSAGHCDWLTQPAVMHRCCSCLTQRVRVLGNPRLLLWSTVPVLSTWCVKTELALKHSLAVVVPPSSPHWSAACAQRDVSAAGSSASVHVSPCSACCTSN